MTICELVINTNLTFKMRMLQVRVTKEAVQGYTENTWETHDLKLLVPNSKIYVLTFITLLPSLIHFP